MGRWRGGATGQPPGPHPAGDARFYAPQPVPDAAVYEAYRDDEKVSALLKQLPSKHNLFILNQSQRLEEREFYLHRAIREKWSSRELERQFTTALFERAVLGPAKVTAVLSQTHPDALSVFKDSHLVEFLDMPQDHLEADLHQGLLHGSKIS